MPLTHIYMTAHFEMFGSSLLIPEKSKAEVYLGSMESKHTTRFTRKKCAKKTPLCLHFDRFWHWKPCYYYIYWTLFSAHWLCMEVVKLQHPTQISLWRSDDGLIPEKSKAEVYLGSMESKHTTRFTRKKTWECHFVQNKHIYFCIEENNNTTYR
jgi:hypothetical protein